MMVQRSRLDGTGTGGSELLRRMEAAVDRVRQRLVRATRALRGANVPYAVIGGHAVAAWVATIDAEAVRNTQDVDLLVHAHDLAAVRAALEQEGFVHRHSAGLDLFLDGPQGSPRAAVYLAFTNQRVKAGEPVANPDLSRAIDTGAFSLIALEDLVRIKLTAFRDKDRTHVRDLIAVGLVDASWLPAMLQVHPLLGERLEELLATPEG